MNARQAKHLLPAVIAAAGWLVAPGASGGATAPSAERARTGEQVVQYQCSLCHGPGLSGAPRIGDGKAWGARAQVGMDNLLRSAIRGRGAMPPSGGLGDLTEPELRAAIAYMLDRSGVPSQ